MSLSHAARTLRDEARAQGSVFVTGGQCKRGHSGLRYAANYTCVACGAEQRTRAEENRRIRRDSDPEFGAHRRAQRAAQNSRYRKRNRPKKNVEWAAWRAGRLNRTPAWADHEKIKAFYRLASAFSKLYVPHHVDHIIPLNGAAVSGLHVEGNLQVITATDNLLKGSQLLAA
jgi:hypothetical protein